jgi:Uma2 family endonuclease
MTTEELLALPDDGMERWLIDGELRERPRIIRDRHHSRVLVRVCQSLANWLDQQPAPRGQGLAGEAGTRLQRDPDTTVGIDVLYISPEVLARQRENSPIIEGAPTLAVEILSPNDTFEVIHGKLSQFRRAGVPQVWVVHPYDKTVTVHRAGELPALFNVDQELSGDPHLPGLRVPVARLFERRGDRWRHSQAGSQIPDGKEQHNTPRDDPQQEGGQEEPENGPLERAEGLHHGRARLLTHAPPDHLGSLFSEMLLSFEVGPAAGPALGLMPADGRAARQAFLVAGALASLLLPRVPPGAHLLQGR